MTSQEEFSEKCLKFARYRAEQNGQSANRVIEPDPDYPLPPAGPMRECGCSWSRPCSCEDRAKYEGWDGGYVPPAVGKA